MPLLFMFDKVNGAPLEKYAVQFQGNINQKQEHTQLYMLCCSCFI